MFLITRGARHLAVPCLFAHPTLSEAFYEAALDMSDEAIHILKEGSSSN
jgi:hypothetical protein